MQTEKEIVIWYHGNNVNMYKNEKKGNSKRFSEFGRQRQRRQRQRRPQRKKRIRRGRRENKSHVSVFFFHPKQVTWQLSSALDHSFCVHDFFFFCRPSTSPYGVFFHFRSSMNKVFSSFFFLAHNRKSVLFILFYFIRQIDKQNTRQSKDCRQYEHSAIQFIIYHIQFCCNISSVLISILQIIRWWCAKYPTITALG